MKLSGKRVEEVPLSRIRAGGLTLFSRPLESEPLRVSIRNMGVITPLLLWEVGGGRLRVVSGHRRLSACQALGFSSLSALIAKRGELTDEGAIELNLAENLSQRALTEVEKAEALHKLETLGIAQERLIEHYLPLLGARPSLALLHQYLALGRVEEEVKDYLTERAWPLGDAFRLASLEGEERLALVRLLKELRASVSAGREIFELCRELSRRDEVTIEELLLRPALREALELKGKARARALLEVLRFLRYPELEKLKRRAESLIRRGELPREIKFEWPQALEE
ncbi:MAG: ParB/RepB/Spo0J family partition protein, partial [Nitrospinota bacterium]